MNYICHLFLMSREAIEEIDRDGSTMSSTMFGKKEVHIVMAGLGFAGKTTIVNKLKLDRVVPTQPTVGYNVENVEYNNVNLLIYDFTDVQLREAGPLIWKMCLSHCAQGCVYEVDTNDRERITEARDKLYRMLNEDNLRADVPLLVFANKQDLPNVMSTLDITLKLNLHSLHPRLWRIQATCAITGEGLHEGLDWLCRHIASNWLKAQRTYTI